MSVALNYRSDIDGLRAIAVLAVVAHHLLPVVAPGGYVGVDVFFVISGYLITGIINREISEGRFSFVKFYERRVRRLFPALFTMLAIVLVAGYFLLLPSDYRLALRSALGTIFFCSNIVFWKSMAAGYFAADAKLNPLLHTWSLAVEEQFYLFFPLIFLFCFRFCRRYLILILLACATVSLILASLWAKRYEVATFFLSPFRAWELMAGGLLALDVLPSLRVRFLRETVGAAALAAIAFSIFCFDTRTGVPGIAALVPVLGATALIHVGGSGGSVVSRLLRWKPVVYVGLMSYSLYLWHWPLIVLTRFELGMDSLDPYAPVLFVVSLALGSVSYHFIEQPFRARSRVGRRAVFEYAAIAASVLTVAVGIGIRNGGNENRYDAEVKALDQARYPVIPYVECDKRADWCRLGMPDIPPRVLLWGDSHLLAWAPVLDKVLNTVKTNALFVENPACPPLLGVASAEQADCQAANLKVREYLETTPSIASVVMVANWRMYFGAGTPLRFSDPSHSASNVEPAAIGLRETVRWLVGRNIDVYLIGPVPVYAKDVPLALALEKVLGRSLLTMTLNMHRDEQSGFFRTIEGLDDERLHIVDPASWMCVPKCVVQSGGVSLYRDSNHLSVAGALFAQAPMTAAMQGLSARGQTMAIPAGVATGNPK